MIAATIAGVVVTAMLLGSLVGSIALAQDGRAQRWQDRSSDPRYEAPIGCAPATTAGSAARCLRDEGRVTPTQKDFDQSLQICRPC
jgi:hypothetical protein